MGSNPKDADTTSPTEAIDQTLIRTGEDPTDPIRMDQMPSGVDISDAVQGSGPSVIDSPTLIPQAPKQRIGPFQITGILGSGGMGMVYRAQTAEGRPAAVKVLSSGLDGQLLRRFQREATIRIDHPNVVKVLAADIRTERTPYIAFELLEGESLDARLEHGVLTHEEALNVGVQACRGLAHAHRLGIVHRDLKPGNIFLCRDQTVKVLDFGIALLTERETRLTISGAVMGTPSYLSPEQARGEIVFDGRTDVWGMGAVLYHAVSGKPPFRASSALATIVAVLMEPIEPLARCAPSVPPSLATIIERALAKPRDERWQNMDELLSALEKPGLIAPLAHDLEVPPVMRSTGEQRVVAVMLAYGVKDAQRLEREVTSRGGRILPLAGHCIVGLFGVDTWTGDEVMQAVAAGQASLDVAQRIAVTSGHATKVGARFSGGALTAAEVACAANLDGLVLNAEAAREVAGAYQVIEEQPGIYRVRSRHRSVSKARRAEVATSDMVGRDAEMAHLRRGLRTVAEEGRLVVALISGPAGIGKGRLRQEAQTELSSLGATGPSSGLLARARPHQRSIALSVLRSMLETRSDQLIALHAGPRLDANAPLGERQHAVHRLALDAIPDRRAATSCAEFLAELLGVPMPESASLRAARSDPQLMTDRLRGALRDYFTGFLERGPLGLFIEELQWADVESLRFLAELADFAADRPLFVLATARPELDMRSVELFTGRDVLTIELQGLASFDVASLARAIAGRELPDALVRALYERTGGNPLFVEQIITALADEGRLDAEVGELPLPLTVEAAVQARLDHLPPAERDIVKRTSILGRPFFFPEVVALGAADPAHHLESLVRRGIFASRKREQSERGPELRFRSALVADVASRMISDAQRIELHRRAASYLADLPDTDPEELARHYELGDTKLLAAKHYALAAIASSRRGDSDRVVRCARRSIELGAPKALLFDVRMAESEALQFLGRHREQQPVLASAISSAKNEAERARALTETIKWNVKNGDVAKALDTGREAVASARQAGSPEVLALALGRFGFALTAAGELAEARTSLAEAEEAAAACPAHVRALTAAWRAHLATALGDLGERSKAFEAARAMYREAGDLRRAAGAEVNLADVYNRIGAYREAERALREALEGCKKVGNRPMMGYALLNLGYSLGMLGRIDDAMESLARSRYLAEQMREPRLGLLARVYAARAASARPPDRTDDGEAAKARQDAEDAAMEAEGRGLRGIAVSAFSVAAAMCLIAGDQQRGLLLSTRAMAMLGELGALEEDEAEVYLVHAKALIANGQKAEARAVIERGWARVAELSAKITDEQLRTHFVRAVPAHRDLKALGTMRRH